MSRLPSSDAVSGSPSSAACGAIESPTRPPLRSGPCEIRGWIGLPDVSVAPEFLLAGRPVGDVRFADHPEAAARHPEFPVRGWSCTVELGPEHAGPRGVVEFEVRQARSVVARAAWRFDRRDLPEPAPLVLFLHVPKCAGTSIRTQLEEYPDAIRVAELNDASLPWDRSTRDSSRDLIERLLAGERSDADVLCGHYWYGIHRYLRRPTRYITILRNPFDQVISNYLYRKYALREPRWAACPSVVDALANFPGHFDNEITRYLAGVGGDAAVDGDILESAKAALDHHFDLVGFAESMPDTCRRFGRYLGVPLSPVVRNPTPPSPERDNLDIDRFRAAALDLVRYDLELFLHAQRHRSCFA